MGAWAIERPVHISIWGLKPALTIVALVPGMNILHFVKRPQITVGIVCSLNYYIIITKIFSFFIY